MRISAVSLIRSQLRPEGAIYTRLSQFEMTGG
jgi:2'-5' RNA ligase